MSLSKSCLKRRLSLPGGRVAYLAPPSVGEVVQIMGVLQGLEDESDVQLLFELLSGLQWSGALGVLQTLRKIYSNNPKRFVKLLQDLLTQGIDLEPETGEDSEVDWNYLLTKYCRISGKDAYDVWNEVPFPFFMERMKEIEKEEGRRHIDAAIESSFAMGGSEKAMKRWERQAGISTEPTKDSVKDISPEQAKRNMKILARMRNKK